MKNKRALFALQAENLSVGRRGQTLLSGVNFTLQPGSSLAVIGESGCGKTTLLQTLAGILPAVAGDVACHSSESAGKPVNAIVWQNLALFPWLTVAGNLALPLKLKKNPILPNVCAKCSRAGARRTRKTFSCGALWRSAAALGSGARAHCQARCAFHGRTVFGA